MVLADLGKRINGALSQLSAASVIDEQVLDSILKEIATALFEADVNVKLVANLRNKVKTKVAPALGSSGNKKSVIQRAVFDELVQLVDPGPEAAAPFTPKKGQSNVIMFVGLQGAGKTTSCTKLAIHYKRRGYKTCLVCADTFRAGAFDQLKQNATKAKIPFYGSYTETDPVVISAQGVHKFREERFDIIIVDTSGRHRQETELFEEMMQISRQVKPDQTIMVLDGAIGQAAESQSRAFKEAADFGAIIVTKMDGHAKGGGAISAVAATKTPIIFIGTGEHLHDLEKFSPEPFISKMLGMGDMQGLMETVQEVHQNNPNQRAEMLKKLEAGVFTVRDLKDQMSNIMSMGPLSKIAQMIPGMGDMLGGENSEAASHTIKRMMYIFDAMTAEELESDGKLFHTSPTNTEYREGQLREPNKRVLRIARGSGTSVQECEGLLAQHRMFAEMAKKAGGKGGWMQKAKQMQQGGGALPQGRMPSMDQLSRMLPAGMAEQVRAMGGPEAMMKQMGGMAGLQNMMKGMGGGA
ncbi:hypothetical protein E5Q_00182 [Mixia osmundae IAM 14324]|uniref:Signal recognition particle 54 kDa protein n=1 Tax=Mixia osmundae (strain CBS 9802 / IAM 14324 / JCM 22182 / KY 12970) TaxID=764103 RepID=G7DSH8_MIXOS|nr:hypothetical protein E5Q_00182 [Mixia osmundae IAM 14324]